MNSLLNYQDSSRSQQLLVFTLQQRKLRHEQKPSQFKDALRLRHHTLRANICIGFISLFYKKNHNDSRHVTSLSSVSTCVRPFRVREMRKKVWNEEYGIHFVIHKNLVQSITDFIPINGRSALLCICSFGRQGGLEYRMKEGRDEGREGSVCRFQPKDP